MCYESYSIRNASINYFFLLYNYNFIIDNCVYEYFIQI